MCSILRLPYDLLEHQGVFVVADCAAVATHGHYLSHRIEGLMSVMHIGCDWCTHSME